MVARGILGAAVIESEVRVNIGHGFDHATLLQSQKAGLGHATHFPELKAAIAFRFCFVEALNYCIPSKQILHFEIANANPSVSALFIESPDLHLLKRCFYTVVKALLRDEKRSKNGVQVFLDVLSFLHNFPLLVQYLRWRSLA